MKGFQPLPGTLFAAFLLAVPALAQTNAGADSLEGLVRDSPFMPGAAAASAGAGAQQGPLELRSVVLDRGAYMFSIYDQGTRTSAWVRLDEPGYPFLAKSFDREKDTLTVEQGGRSMTLALQSSKIIAGQAMPQPSPLPLPQSGDQNNQVAGPRPPGQGGPGMTPNAGGPVPAQVAPTDEAQRLQRIADEIRRRRGVGNPPQLPRNPK